MKRASGFTVIELLSCIVLLCIVGTLILIQKNNIDASSRDQERKTAINAIYYGLKEGYVAEHKSYPTAINKETMPYIDPKSFEPVGDDPQYKLEYRGLDCTGTSCQKFEIRTKLEREAEYKKTSD